MTPAEIQRPNADGCVLVNELGITDPNEIDDIELILVHPFREGNGRLSGPLLPQPTPSD